MMLIVPGTAPEFNMAMKVLVPAVVLVTELARFRMIFEVIFNGAPLALFVMPLITPVEAVVVPVRIPALLNGPPATPVVVSDRRLYTDLVLNALVGAAQRCVQSVVVARDRQGRLPRDGRKLVIRRLCLVCANTGSTITLRLR